MLMFLLRLCEKLLVMKVQYMLESVALNGTEAYWSPIRLPVVCLTGVDNQFMWSYPYY